MPLPSNPTGSSGTLTPTAILWFLTPKPEPKNPLRVLSSRAIKSRKAKTPQAHNRHTLNLPTINHKEYHDRTRTNPRSPFRRNRSSNHRTPHPTDAASAGTEQAHDQAERAQTLDRRLRLTTDALNKVAHGHKEHARSLNHLIQDLPAFAQQAAEKGEPAKVESRVILHPRGVPSTTEAFVTDHYNPDGKLIQDLVGNLGESRLRTKDLTDLLTGNVPEIPPADENAPRKYYGDQRYRQGNTIFIPAAPDVYGGKPGTLLTLTSPNIPRAGEETMPQDRGNVNNVRVGIVITADPEGFGPMPKDLPEQHQRAKAAREQLQASQTAAEKASQAENLARWFEIGSKFEVNDDVTVLRQRSAPDGGTPDHNWKIAELNGAEVIVTNGIAYKEMSRLELAQAQDHRPTELKTPDPTPETKTSTPNSEARPEEPYQPKGLFNRLFRR